MNFFYNLLFVSLCSSMFSHTTHMVVQHIPKHTQTFEWIYWNYHLLLVEFLLKTVKCGALLENGARGMGKGQGNIPLEPGQALEKSSVFVCFAVPNLLVHGELPSQLNCCTTKVLKTRKILINKYSGDEQKVWHYIFSHGKKNLCFIPRLKLHPCLMCFYQSLKHLTLLKWLSGKIGNLKKVPYLDLAPCSSVEGFFFDTNSIRNLVYHLKRKKVIFGSI